MAVARGLVVVRQRGSTGRGQGDHTRARIDRVPAVVVACADGEGHVIAVHVTGLDLAQLDARSGVLVIADRVAGRRRVACAIGARRGEDRARLIRARRRAALVRVFKRRWIIHRCYGDGDLTGGRPTFAVINDNGKLISTVVVRSRHIAVLAGLRVDGNRAIQRRLSDHIRKLITISVSSRDLAVDSSVFRRSDLIVARVRIEALAGDIARITGIQTFVGIHRHWQVIDRSNVNIDCAGAAATMTVRYGDDKCILTVVAGLRRIGVLAGLWIDRNRAIHRLRSDGISQRITIRISTNNTTAHWIILRDGVRVIR